MTSSSNTSRDSIATVTVLHGLLGDQLTQIVVLSLGSLQFSINIIGMAGNIINIIVFIKMGFADSTNVSLLAMAISDLISVTTAIWVGISFMPAFINSGIPFRSNEVHHLTGSLLHTATARTTGFITAFISVERCIAVLFPLKVKTWITPRGNFVGMILIYLITVGPSLGVYGTYQFKWRFYPAFNRTMLGLVKVDTAASKAWTDVSNFLYGILFPFPAFFVVILSTWFLIVRLNRAQRWRQAQTGTKGMNKERQSENQSNGKETKAIMTKEDRVIKMVIVIASVFVVSAIPGCIAFLLTSIVPGFNVLGRYRNTYDLIYCVGFTGEAVNSSVNIFIYYLMTTKFRKTIHELVGKRPMIS